MANILRKILEILVSVALLVRSAFRFKKKCNCTTTLHGKTVLITGGTSGLGRETAKELAKKGAKVIITSRSIDNAQQSAKELTNETGNENILPKQLDLSSFKSIHHFAEDILNKESQLDILINNAGVFGKNSKHTADGIVEDLQVNYFGPFLLTLLLLPLLIKSKPNRIINISSLLHYTGTINLKHLNTPNYYNLVRQYANGKLCMMSWTLELSRRLYFYGISVNALHPGVIKTGITPDNYRFISILFNVWCWLCSRTLNEGVQTILHVVLSSDSVFNEDSGMVINSGRYWSDCRICQPALQAEDVLLARKLWDYSIDIVKFKPKTETEKVIAQM